LKILSVSLIFNILLKIISIQRSGIRQKEGDMSGRFKIIMEEYKQRLHKRNELAQSTIDTKLWDANRVFEALLATLPFEQINAIVTDRFAGSYSAVIKELQEIAKERPARKSDNK
jgi:hypothetical protein